MDFKVATVNSFFDGVSIRSLTAYSWLILHMRVFAVNKKILELYQKKRMGTHPVESVFQTHEPDVIVVNEVIEPSKKNETIQFLNDHNFYGVELDAAVEVADDFKRGTLVASRYESEPVEIDVQRFFGGRFSALKISELNLIVIEVQGTPFNRLVRKYQIRSIRSDLKKFEEEGYRVIVAGDFNMGIRNSSLNLPHEVGHHTEQSFPSPQFYENICNENTLASYLICGMLKVKQALRSLDHMLYTKQGLKVVSSEPIETIVDHCALLASFRAK